MGGALGAGACAMMPEVFDSSLSKSMWIAIFIGLSNIPDIDLLLFLVPKKVRGESRLWTHRGITHGLVGCVCFALLSTMLLNCPILTWKGAAMFSVFSGVVALHLICDTVDGSTGICLFAPFCTHWYTTGYRLNHDLPLDVLSTARGRFAFAYGVAIETVFITVPTGVFVLLATWRV